MAQPRAVFAKQGSIRNPAPRKLSMRGKFKSGRVPKAPFARPVEHEMVWLTDSLEISRLDDCELRCVPVFVATRHEMDHLLARAPSGSCILWLPPTVLVGEVVGVHVGLRYSTATFHVDLHIRGVCRALSHALVLFHVSGEVYRRMRRLHECFFPQVKVFVHDLVQHRLYHDEVLTREQVLAALHNNECVVCLESGTKVALHRLHSTVLVYIDFLQCSITDSSNTPVCRFSDVFLEEMGVGRAAKDVKKALGFDPAAPFTDVFPPPPFHRTPPQLQDAAAFVTTIAAHVATSGPKPSLPPLLGLVTVLHTDLHAKHFALVPMVLVEDAERWANAGLFAALMRVAAAYPPSHEVHVRAVLCLVILCEYSREGCRVCCAHLFKHLEAAAHHNSNREVGRLVSLLHTMVVGMRLCPALCDMAVRLSVVNRLLQFLSNAPFAPPEVRAMSQDHITVNTLVKEPGKVKGSQVGANVAPQEEGSSSSSRNIELLESAGVGKGPGAAAQTLRGLANTLAARHLTSHITALRAQHRVLRELAQEQHVLSRLRSEASGGGGGGGRSNDNDDDSDDDAGSAVQPHQVVPSELENGLRLFRLTEEYQVKLLAFRIVRLATALPQFVASCRSPANLVFAELLHCHSNVILATDKLYRTTLYGIVANFARHRGVLGRIERSLRVGVACARSSHRLVEGVDALGHAATYVDTVLRRVAHRLSHVCHVLSSEAIASIILDDKARWRALASVSPSTPSPPLSLHTELNVMMAILAEYMQMCAETGGAIRISRSSDACLNAVLRVKRVSFDHVAHMLLFYCSPHSVGSRPSAMEGDANVQDDEPLPRPSHQHARSESNVDKMNLRRTFIWLELCERVIQVLTHIAENAKAMPIIKLLVCTWVGWTNNTAVMNALGEMVFCNRRFERDCVRLSRAQDLTSLRCTLARHYKALAVLIERALEGEQGLEDHKRPLQFELATAPRPASHNLFKEEVGEFNVTFAQIARHLDAAIHPVHGAMPRFLARACFENTYQTEGMVGTVCRVTDALRAVYDNPALPFVHDREHITHALPFHWQLFVRLYTTFDREKARHSKRLATPANSSLGDAPPVASAHELLLAARCALAQAHLEVVVAFSKHKNHVTSQTLHSLQVVEFVGGELGLEDQLSKMHEVGGEAVPATPSRAPPMPCAPAPAHRTSEMSTPIVQRHSTGLSSPSPLDSQPVPSEALWNDADPHLDDGALLDDPDGEGEGGASGSGGGRGGDGGGSGGGGGPGLALPRLGVPSLLSPPVLQLEVPHSPSNPVLSVLSTLAGEKDQPQKRAWGFNAAGTVREEGGGSMRDVHSPRSEGSFNLSIDDEEDDEEEEDEDDEEEEDDDEGEADESGGGGGGSEGGMKPPPALFGLGGLPKLALQARGVPDSARGMSGMGLPGFGAPQPQGAGAEGADSSGNSSGSSESDWEIRPSGEQRDQVAELVDMEEGDDEGDDDADAAGQDRPRAVSVGGAVHARKRKQSSQLAKQFSQRQDKDAAPGRHRRRGDSPLQVFYETERGRRLLYHDPQLHCGVLHLALSVLLAPNRALEPAYVRAHDGDDDQGLDIVRVLSLHVNHRANAGIVAPLSDRCKADGRDAARLLRLLCRQLFNQGLYGDAVHKISAGAFGNVYRCSLPALGLQVAVKNIPLTSQSGGRSPLSDVFAEVSVMDRLRHSDCVCHLFDYGVTKDSYCLVMRLYTQSLRGWALEACGAPPPAPLPALAPRNVAKALGLFAKVLRAVHVLQDNHVVHFDVKCDNFLLSPIGGSCVSSLLEGLDVGAGAAHAHFEVCACDFGTSVMGGHSNIASERLSRGTECVRSPEMLLPPPELKHLLQNAHDNDGESRPVFVPGALASESVVAPSQVPKAFAGAVQEDRECVGRRREMWEVSKKSDVWALGCLLYEILTGRYLFVDEANNFLFVQVAMPNQELLSEEALAPLLPSPSLVALLRWVLDRNPLSRPSLPQLIARFERDQPTIELEFLQHHSRGATLPPRPPSIRKDAPCAPLLTHHIAQAPSFMMAPRFVVKRPMTSAAMALRGDQHHFLTCISGITPRVFVASVVAVAEYEQLHAHGFTHVVNCCDGASDRVGFPGFEVLTIGNESQVISKLHSVAEFIAGAVVMGGKVLLIDEGGSRRVGAVVLAWLVLQYDVSLFDALLFVTGRRVVAQPPQSVLQSLFVWSQRFRDNSGMLVETLAPRQQLNPNFSLGNFSPCATYQCLCGAVCFVLGVLPVFPNESDVMTKAQQDGLARALRSVYRASVAEVRWCLSKDAHVIGDFDRTVGFSFADVLPNLAEPAPSWDLFRCKGCGFPMLARLRVNTPNANNVAVASNFPVKASRRTCLLREYSFLQNLV